MTKKDRKKEMRNNLKGEIKEHSKKKIITKEKRAKHENLDNNKKEQLIKNEKRQRK